jgi:hypothetical protein
VEGGREGRRTVLGGEGWEIEKENELYWPCVCRFLIFNVSVIVEEMKDEKEGGREGGREEGRRAL